MATAALAQDEPTAPEAPSENLFRPQLVRNPDAAFSGYMPQRALERRIAGSVLLCCTPRADRSLSCEVAFEAPEGLGFGDAGRNMVESLMLTEESYAEYRAERPGRPFWQVQLFRLQGFADPPSLPPRSQRDALCAATDQ
ncbi:MAG: hypothetical protein ACT4OF_03065 [Caulobacteraceae bacterium]